MTTSLQNDVEDVCSAVRDGRAVRSHGPYAIAIGDDNLAFRQAVIDDPVPTGRQLLEIVEARPADEHILFKVMANGLLDELGLDETTDLRIEGVEKFLVFRSDRSFRFEIEGRVFEWGGTFISGLTLKKLAGVDPEKYGIWLEVRGADDRLIGDKDLVDLSAKGIERFFTGIVKTTEG